MGKDECCIVIFLISGVQTSHIRVEENVAAEKERKCERHVHPARYSLRSCKFRNFKNENRAY